MFLRRDRIKKIRVPEVTIGAEVLTADGETLGQVKEVGEVSFHVDARMQPDFWLGRDYVIESTADRITMSFIRSELGAYKLGVQGLEPDKDPTQDSLVDAPVAEREGFDQRLRMEQELAEQRRRLPHDHPEGEEAAPNTGGTIGQPVEEELREYGVEPSFDGGVASPAGTVVGETMNEPASAYEPKTATPYDPRRPGGYDPQRAQYEPANFDVSVPTREHPAPDPAHMREPSNYAGAAAVGGLALATVSGLLLLRQRRSRNRSLRDRVRRMGEGSLDRARSR